MMIVALLKEGVVGGLAHTNMDKLKSINKSKALFSSSLKGPTLEILFSLLFFHR